MSQHEVLAQAILTAEGRSDALDAQLKAANASLAAAEAAMASAMAVGDVPAAFDALGVKWKLDATTRITPYGKDTPQGATSVQVVEWIEAHGGESLVKPTMHWSSRNKFLAEVCIDNETGDVSIPVGLEPFVKVETQPRVIRKRLPS